VGSFVSVQATEKDDLCGKMNKKRYLIFPFCLKVLSVVPMWHCFWSQWYQGVFSPLILTRNVMMKI